MTSEESERLEHPSMEKIKVCVTGGSGYIGSWLVKKLLEKGYIVHATLRNLDDESKVGLLKSLPNAETELVLFQADIYSPQEFESAIHGCQFVFHLATPMLHNTNSSQYKDTIEAAIAGVRTIADCCVRSKMVKRLIYTSSVTASSPLKEDESGFKPILDESCWTPLNLTNAYANDFLKDYTISKMLSEKEVLGYNETENGELEVVTLACGLVGGDTMLSFVPESMNVLLSMIKGCHSALAMLQFLQVLLGSIPLLHIDDICEAHIFCMEKPSLRGRFICAAGDPTIQDIAKYYQEYHKGLEIIEESLAGPERGSKCDCTKLMKEGFEYKYDLKKVLDSSLECAIRLRAL